MSTVTYLLSWRTYSSRRIALKQFPTSHVTIFVLRMISSIKRMLFFFNSFEGPLIISNLLIEWFLFPVLSYLYLNSRMLPLMGNLDTKEL
jgi:hypothetical protein